MEPPCCLLQVLMLLLSLRFWIQEGTCQHFYLIRPIPSDSLPVEVPKEDPDPFLDPKEKDLNETELRMVLGSHFDPDFMCGSPPKDHYEKEPEPGPKPSLPIPKEIQAMEFEVQFGMKQKSNRKLRRRLQQLLWVHTLCPVLYAWTDLGLRFWPRYLKSGSCYNKRSCSVPEGMMCRPAKATHLTFLRWLCPQRKMPLKCSWIPVLIPVISECRCACPNRD
nr:noggin-3 [Nothobranchius furzeri]